MLGDLEESVEEFESFDDLDRKLAQAEREGKAIN